MGLSIGVSSYFFKKHFTFKEKHYFFGYLENAKRNEINRNEIHRNETKYTETKSKRNEINRNEIAYI